MRRTTGRIALTLTFVLAAAAVAGAWPEPVPGFKPPAPGEHPRLLFREGDLPAIRKRAETPEGKVIVERLKQQLQGAFTTWHPAGYAFLYQLTGDEAYAKQAAETALAVIGGKGNKDDRYSWPGKGQLRAGPVMAGVALAYDLGYDGWDDATRRRVAEGLQGNPHYDAIANSPRHGPGCNHFGAHQGGLGFTLLALRGDPGVDQARLEKHLEKVTKGAMREITEGFGTRGYYYEGHHCGRLSGNTGLIPFIQAMRVAGGKDLVNGCENAQWLAAKWCYELLLQPDGSYADLERGMYCRNFQRGEQLSSDGDFAEGFGIIPDAWKGALKWTFNHVVQPGPNKDYDVVEYPHHAIFALVNWPIDVPEQNPGEVFPRVMHDRGPNYFVFRSGWGTPEGDLITTALLGSKPGGGRGMAKGGSVMVLGRGIRYTFPAMFYTCELSHAYLAADGSGTITGILLDGVSDKKAKPAIALGKAPNCLAVDYSAASGADLLVAYTGPQIGHRTEYWLDIKKAQVKDEKGAGGYFTKTTPLSCGGHDFYVMTLQKGAAPEPRVDGNRITVGKQTIAFDGQKLVLGTIAGPMGGPSAAGGAGSRATASRPADPEKDALRIKNLTRRLDYAKTLIEQNQARRAKLMLHDIATNHGDTEPGREAAKLLETLK